MIDLLRLGFDEGISADKIADGLRRHAGDVENEDVDRLAGVLEQYLRTILTYIFDEEDLLPEASYGVVRDARRRLPRPRVRGLAEAEAVLPEGVAESLRRTCESTIQVAQALFPSRQRVDAADVPLEPQLRVAEAAAAAATEPIRSA
jgi:hypothetical protein